MTEKSTPHLYFGKLADRLFEIEHNPIKACHGINKATLSEINRSNLLSCNFEDVLHYLSTYKNLVSILLEKLPSIIKTIKFPLNPFLPKGPLETEMTKEQELIANITEKEELLSNFSTELSIYMEELTTLYDHVANLNLALGDDRFSNAGSRLNFRLTVPEIGSLFGLLYHSKLIDHKKPDNNELSEKELSKFIIKNFTAGNYSKIGETSLTNQLSQFNDAGLKKIEKAIEELEKRIRNKP